MLKFLRKYNKWLLVVFGSFLMVSFLAPQAIQQFGQQQLGRTVATVGDREVSLREQQIVSGEYDALKQLFENFTALNLRGQEPTIPDFAPFIGEDRTHWLLLAHAANQAGFVGGPINGRNWIFDTFTLPMAELFRDVDNFRRSRGEDIPDRTPEDYIAIAQNQIEQALRIAQTNMVTRDPEAFNNALAKAQGVVRMIDAYTSVNRVSRPRTARDAKRLLDYVVVDVAIIRAALGVPADAPEPTQEQLLAHFNEYRDVRADQSEVGVGYRQPPRVKLEWLVLDPASIESSISVSDVEARAELKRNRAAYPDDDREALEQIRAAMRAEEVEQRIAQARSLIRGDVQKSLEGLDRDGPYRVLPDGWEPMGFAEIAGDVERSINIALPEVNRREQRWLNRTDLAQLPGIGASRVRVGAQQLGFADAVLTVREIESETRPESSLALQVGVPALSAEAEDAQGRIYFFTVLDARPESPADSMDEVIDEVRAGYDALRGLDRLREEQGVILETVRIDGLEALEGLYNPADEEDRAELGSVILAEALRVGSETVQPSPFTQSILARPIADFVNVEAFRDAVVETASGIDPLSDPETIAPQDRWLAVALPTQAAMAVARIEGIRPLTRERLRTEWNPIRAQSARADELGPLIERVRTLRGEAIKLAGPFSRERLAERLGYVDLDTDPDDEDAAEADTAADADTETESAGEAGPAGNGAESD